MKEKTVNFIEAEDIKGITLVTPNMFPEWAHGCVNTKFWVDAGDSSTANGEYIYAEANGCLAFNSAVDIDEFSNESEVCGVIPMLFLSESYEPGTVFMLNKTTFRISDYDPTVAVCDEAVASSGYYLVYHGKKCKVENSNVVAWLHGWLAEQFEE